MITSLNSLQRFLKESLKNQDLIEINTNVLISLKSRKYQEIEQNARFLVFPCVSLKMGETQDIQIQEIQLQLKAEAEIFKIKKMMNFKTNVLKSARSKIPIIFLRKMITFQSSPSGFS